jgi:hypothetical protein
MEEKQTFDDTQISEVATANDPQEQLWRKAIVAIAIFTGGVAALGLIILEEILDPINPLFIYFLFARSPKSMVHGSWFIEKRRQEAEGK